ncbi:MFS transporter, partial [Salmonella enterica subsp. enterica serovar Enteritidis]|nr:MFS transporter [Salmonella enterica subsp. enterica serovar Enteritidis]
GLIYDTFASYTWLYVGSWAVGIGAFLIMMTFRPMQTARPDAVPAPA